MSDRGTSILGGKSVYCINEKQLQEAVQLADESSEAGDNVRSAIASLEATLTRNERAAVAFVLIERLRQFPDT